MVNRATLVHLRRSLLVTCLVALSTVVSAQEESLRPGINDGFAKSDTDDYYQAGWEYYEDGYWSYYHSVDGETWDYSTFGVFGHLLVDSEWSGWSWSQDFYTLAPDNIPLVATGLLGDIDGNGVVDIVDYRKMLTQFGLAPGDHSADLNGDNIVNLADFAILRGSFGSTTESAFSPESLHSVPEPTTLVFLILGGAVALARKGR